jgi:hypothetical protein
MSRTRISNHGAWLPWDVVEQAIRLRLRPASRWQVYLFILCVSARFGRRDAILTVKSIAEKVGFSERTVKDCIADLVAMRLITRPARYVKLRVTALKRPRLVVPAEDW